MSWLARIEEACAAFIEQTFARTFPTDVEPAHIARKLVATMEARTTHEGEKAFAPSRYVVRVSTGDFERLKPHQLYLEEEWAALLTDMAQLVSITLAPPLLVRLREDSGVVAGAVEIDATESQRATGGGDPAAKQFVLRMLKGLPVDAVYPVRDAVCIGRNKGNDIVIVDPRVSRTHARIDLVAGAATLTDLNSTNGTLENGERVRGRVTLENGATVTVGNTSLRFEEAGR
ncbi:MAG: hypothetical protein NVS9B12_11710 [Vulcanimicrobiaceae bacterium]